MRITFHANRPDLEAGSGGARRNYRSGRTAGKFIAARTLTLMGHSDVATTLRYIDVNENDKRDAIAAVFGPVGGTEWHSNSGRRGATP